MIPLWSDINPTIKEMLLPSIGADWSDLTSGEKKRMWKYMERELYDSEPLSRKALFSQIRCNYQFFGEASWDNDHLVKTIISTVFYFNEKYKKASYASMFLVSNTYDNACHDFYRIFIEEEMNVVFELLSMYGNVMVSKDSERVYKKDNENDDDYESRVDEEKWERFDKFTNRLNEVFTEFGIKYKLTRDGFVSADEPVVIDKIYKPALGKLSAGKWAPVNRDLTDAFKAIDEDGSGAITHATSALQGFLQILVKGKTGKGEISKLITEGMDIELIPNDEFSKQVIGNINSYWAKERKDKGDPHPKKTYATKEQAKLVVSLVMVFVDYVL